MKHYNPSISERMNHIFNLKGEQTNQVADFIQPTLEIQPRVNIIKLLDKSTSGNGTIYTTPSDKDFYLTAATLSFQKDATCDAASSGACASIIVSIEGVSVRVLSMIGITTTAGQGQQTINFSNPIKLDRNTTILLGGGTFAAGAMSRSGCIMGYTQETIKGV